MTWDERAFKEKLDGTHNFPDIYIFKFIVKHERKAEVELLVKEAEVSLKPSSGNKYVSVTIKAHMQTSDEVVEVYKEAKKIEGLIAL
ncbi:MAG: DUF493 family protein [Cyclobacteriaceae bacterium]